MTRPTANTYRPLSFRDDPAELELWRIHFMEVHGYQPYPNSVAILKKAHGKRESACRFTGKT